MARLARLVIPDYPHYITQSGVRGMTVFKQKSDYINYLDLLKEGCKKAKSKIISYCLMPNQIHLILIPSTEDGLRASLGETHRCYTRIINDRENCIGHLWQERFHSFPMDEDHLLSCIKYVELSPVRAGLVEKPQSWLWSSARSRIKNEMNIVADNFAILNKTDNWASFLQGNIKSAELEQFQKHSLTGRPLGSEQWVTKLETITGRRLKKQKPGPKLKKADN